MIFHGTKMWCYENVVKQQIKCFSVGRILVFLSLQTCWLVFSIFPFSFYFVVQLNLSLQRVCESRRAVHAIEGQSYFSLKGFNAWPKGIQRPVTFAGLTDKFSCSVSWSLKQYYLPHCVKNVMSLVSEIKNYRSLPSKLPVYVFNVHLFQRAS